MSQRSKKKSNIIFTIFIIILVLASIGITYYFIRKHNSDSIFNTKNLFKYASVSRKDVIDVFNKYPVNALDIVSNEEEFKISGLKNKELENKINERLNKLKDSSDTICQVSFNVSNVFSAVCNSKVITIDLNTGNDLKIEEIYQRNSDLNNILLSSIYESACNYRFSCYANYTDYDEEYYNNIENYLAEVIRNIQNKKYNILLDNNGFYLIMLDGEWIRINFYNSPNDITIFNRFINNNLYEKKVDYCDYPTCNRINYSYQGEDYSKINYLNDYYLNKNDFISINIYNGTDYDILKKRYDTSTEIYNYAMKDIGKKIEDSIINKYNLNNKNNNYKYITIYGTINNIKDGLYHVVSYNITTNEYNKDNFIKFNLGYFDAKTINTKVNNYVNLIIKDDKLLYMEDNPYDVFTNFEDTLLKYIKGNLKSGDDYESDFYSLCCGHQFSEGYEKTDYRKKIQESSYLVDKENKILIMNNDNQLINIPWNIFEEKEY